MLTERDIIDIVNEAIPSDSNRETACHASDAERLRFEGGGILLSVDDFSAEDQFPEADAKALGWNIAVGAVSDILAAGGTPLYFAHALTIASDWDRDYLRRFCDGIGEVLGAYEMSFAGGDVGRAAEFRCAATVLGKPGRRPLSRVGAKAGDGIFITGPVGGGNYNAALSILGLGDQFPPWRFPVRREEAKTVQLYANSCIDTSDGVFSGLNTLADLNGIGYVIDEIPFCEEGRRVAERASLPEEVLFFGGCGEYELLFTVDVEAEPKMVEEGFHRIGECVPEGRIVQGANGRIHAETCTMEGRDFGSVKDYLAALVSWLEQWKNES